MHSTADITDDADAHSMAVEVRTLLSEGCGLPVADVTRRLAHPAPVWQSVVCSVLLEQATRFAAELWERGWQPADLYRRTTKEKDKAARAFLAVGAPREA